MIGDELLKRIRCPVHGDPLVCADDALVARLNERIAAGNLENRSGQPVEGPLDGGLINPSHKLLYPVREQIPCLMADEAIPLEHVGS